MSFIFWDLLKKNFSKICLIFAAVVLLGSFFIAMIPPFQSPDEFHHIARAYMLTNGVVFLDSRSEDGRIINSGGKVDTGLSEYMESFRKIPAKHDIKVDKNIIDKASQVNWTGRMMFMGAPGTGYYFPLIYTPQSLGLYIGEILGLRVHDSYNLARFFTLFSVAFILSVSFIIYPVNPFALSLLLIPMSLFQFSSATIDGLSTALAIFSISCFLRIYKARSDTNIVLFYLFSFAVFLLCSSRMHCMPFFILLFSSCFFIKKKHTYAVSVLVLLFVLSWILVSMKITVMEIAPNQPSKTSILLYYFIHPFSFLKLTFKTLTDPSFYNFYIASFIGNLGWLDAPFSKNQYSFFSLLIVFSAVLSISVKKDKSSLVFLLLFFSSICSVLMIFLALLVAWNPHPAVLINGVQGRYFLIPALMAAYSIAGEKKFAEGMLRKLSVLVLAILLIYSAYSSTVLLLERYYISG